MNEPFWPFKGEPLTVQAAALARAGGKSRWGYFLEQGLGKTQLILAEAELLRRSGDVRNLAIVCPNSTKVAVWKREAEKVGSAFEVVVWPDPPPTTPNNIMFVINYEAVITAKGGPTLERFIQKDCMLVLDESVAIKNYRAKRTKALLGMSLFPKYTRLLSGLPVVQNAFDLWAQLRMLGANTGRAIPFKFHFCRLGGFQNKVIIGTQNEEELAALVKSVSWRALKKDWTDLPEKLYSLREYKLTPPQRKAYALMLKDFLLQIDEQNVVTAPLAVTQLTKLMQISSGWIYDGTGTPTDLVPVDENPKLALLEEILEQTPGKVIVFANYRYTMELLRRRWPDAPSIIGGMKREDVDAAVQKFNNSDCKLILCQITSAKYGLTLLGSDAMRCSTTVYLENSYSLDARAQSEDRNHRHGQRNPVLYLDLIGTDVEMAALAILARKADLAGAVMDRKSELRQAMQREAAP